MVETKQRRGLNNRKDDEMIEVVVTVGEKEFPMKFTKFWQVEALVHFLNWYVKLLGWWYGK